MPTIDKVNATGPVTELRRFTSHVSYGSAPPAPTAARVIGEQKQSQKHENQQCVKQKDIMVVLIQLHDELLKQYYNRRVW
jgi:hypothetical protein